jgi:Mitochondrial carrier protein
MYCRSWRNLLIFRLLYDNGAIAFISSRHSKSKLPASKSKLPDSLFHSQLAKPSLSRAIGVTTIDDEDLFMTRRFGEHQFNLHKDEMQYQHSSPIDSSWMIAMTSFLGIILIMTTNPHDAIAFATATGVATDAMTSGVGDIASSSSLHLGILNQISNVPHLPSDLLLSNVDVNWNEILHKASQKALGGGKAGAAAAVVQVCSLMWLRTAMNYQYRYGGTLSTSLRTLWSEGGIQRLYQGLPFALVQGPLTRFGDTAANVGMLSLLDSILSASGSVVPLPLKTAVGSAAAGLFRIILMPIDTSKTALQVEGPGGLSKLWSSVWDQRNLGPLYQGALASAAATAAGHYPWFLTYNALDAQLPLVSREDDLLLYLMRSAVLGLSASCVSDCVSNSLRVIKTTKQTAALSDSGKDPTQEPRELSYPEVIKMILETDGVRGLFGRGLQTRLLTNAIQGSLFSVLWRYFQQAGGA